MFTILQKAFIPLVLALFIDGLQALISISFFGIGTALQAVTPVGGGVGGAAVGAYYCWNATSGVWTAITEAAKCAAGGGILGAAASAGGIPLGLVLGFVVNAVISLTFGIGLIALMGSLGLWNPVYMGAALFGETLPFLDNLPVWTGMVIWCVYKKATKEKLGLVPLANAILEPSSANMAGAARNMKKQVDGITARNSGDTFIYDAQVA